MDEKAIQVANEVLGYALSSPQDTPLTKGINKTHRSQNVDTVSYPIAITATQLHPLIHSHQRSIGTLVGVVMFSDEHAKQIRLGLYLGRLPVQTIGNYDPVDKDITIDYINEAAIYLPELRAITYGSMSSWYIVKSEEDLDDIIDIKKDSYFYKEAIEQIKRIDSGIDKPGDEEIMNVY